MSGNRFSRRYFFYGSLLAGAMPAGGFGATPSLKAAGYKSPNEKLNIAAIGAGGRASSDIAGVAGENLVAFCDVDDDRAAATYKKYPNAPKYKDFRQMLDKEGGNIDAVTIAIPDHMHGTAAIWAMQRGKHVYVEKPLTHSVWEARMLTEAAAKYGVATQMGNQGYSNEGARIASEIIWSGEIGDVTEVHAWTDRPIWPHGGTTIPSPEAPPATLDWDKWLGVAAARPFTTGGAAYAKEQKTSFGFYQPFNWRGFFDFGCGAIGDMALHLLGAVNMGLRLTSPTSVEVIHQEGKSAFMFPKKSVTRFDFPARGAMPPVKIFWHDAAKEAAYRPEGIPAGERIIGGLWSLPMPTTPPAPLAPDAKPVNLATAENNGVVFLGTKGIMTTDTYAGSVRLLPASRMEDYRPPAQMLTRSPGHHRDWIRACKGGDPACSNFSVSGPFTEWLLTGAVALHFDGKLDWDSSKMQFTNNKAANDLLKPMFRKGWEWPA